MPFPGYLDLRNLRERFPEDFSPSEVARAQTSFLKRLSLKAHAFYGGKMMTVPKAGIYDFGWFGVWYTPGVSAVSTAIRDDNLQSYKLSNRSNLVAIVSDSTRVLGDGDCSPSGGLGVMEGKAFLMYYLGGISAMALCINTHDHPDSYKAGFVFNERERHAHLAQRTIDFVRMAAPSFGAVNLEDIAQPNCFKVLDDLQDCGIPVWHDDAQGTACVTLAGMINAIKLAGKTWGKVKAVFLGAGASNATIIRLMLAEGLDPSHVIAFDSKGALHAGRDDVKADTRFYRKWQICQATNPDRIDDIREACQGADILCALSTPGPHTVKKEWIELMGEKPIVFVCANPVPEIYPHEAREAGAFIVATGRSDFPNQVNNSMCFPGLLKGSLLVHASRVTDAPWPSKPPTAWPGPSRREAWIPTTSCPPWMTWTSSPGRRRMWRRRPSGMASPSTTWIPKRSTSRPTGTSRKPGRSPSSSWSGRRSPRPPRPCSTMPCRKPSGRSAANWRP